MVINQYEVYLINLDPTIGNEIKKSRPFLVISPDEMNHNISTLIIAPMTTKSRNYPTRVSLQFNKVNGRIVLDQLRTIDKLRIIKKLGSIESKTIKKVKEVLNEMLIE